MTKRRCFVVSLVLLSLWLARPSVSSAAEDDAKTEKQMMGNILQYISAGWGALTRSLDKCQTVSDPKAPEKSVLYLPAGFAIPAAVQELQKNCSVRVEHLPVVIEKLGGIEVGKIRQHGLLYLEHPYVVPGGMSTRCMAGTVTSSCGGCCEKGNSSWPEESWRTFFSG